MRDELHLMELVDRYLDGAMGAEERAAFEGRMDASSELRGLVEDQRALREGFQRLQLRSAVASAHRTWLLRRWIPWAAAGVLVVAGAVLLLSMPTHEQEADRHEPQEVIEVPQQQEAAPADVAPPTEGGDAGPDPVPELARVPAKCDTIRGEGRIITHLITEQPDGSVTDSLVSSVSYTQ